MDALAWPAPMDTPTSARGAQSLSAVVIAGTHSGVGKTSITLGLIGALVRRGLAVQPFKVGPDFIDPLHHSHTSGRVSRNLDGWMLSADINRERFARASADADVCVVEGVMGLFDGSDGNSERGSTAEMAKLLGLPVVLVVDASAMARSAAALIHGFSDFDPDLRIAGVILNNVGGEAHADMIRDALGGAVPVLGATPRAADIAMPERHLGLHLPHEGRRDYVERLADLIEAHLDLDALLQASRIARLPVPQDSAVPAPVVRIGVARDDAFCFYYAENLELLADAGAELVEFSPIADRLPEDLDGLYFGGGYPELHGAELSQNIEMLEAIRGFAAAGGPIYAECGGLMYLAEQLEIDEQTYRLCGVLPLATRMPAPLRIAYTEIATTGGLFGAGHAARGHLFHQSEIVREGPMEHGYELRTNRGERSQEGFGVGNVLASYAHLHLASAPELAGTLVRRCSQFRAREAL